MLDQTESKDHSRTLTPWPYPLLCLAWRLEWGGRRLIDPHEPRTRSDEPSSPAGEIYAIADAGPNEVDDEGPDAWAGDGTGGAVADRVQATLANSPMMPPSRSAAATGALAATVSLIRLPLARRRDVEVPSFWQAALACWPGFRTPCQVPSPRPRWDPATWTLVCLLEGIWDTTGTTFLGRERPLLFRVAGTRRMAARHGWSDRRALACGRTAHRTWRHWFETREAPRLASIARWPVPAALRHQLPDMAAAYRRIRAARRTGQWTQDLDAVPASCRVMLAHLAEASIGELQPPVVAGRPTGLRDAVARALLASPLGHVAAQSCLDTSALRAAAEQTAARLLWLLTAPWPWAPRPVVRGPRRARQEARARATGR
jgi:hypothetical protein